MVRLYLVRHGQTDWNLLGRVQGSTDIPLNEPGRRQVERLAARLAGIDFVAAYTSDRARALETADAILHGRPLQAETAPEMREAAYGEWEGLTYREAEARDPDLCVRYMAGDVEAVPPGGESIAEHLARIAAFTASLVERHPAGDLLLVAHAGSLRGMVICTLGLPAESFWGFQVDQASLSVIAVGRRGGVLESWNCTSHLDGPV